MRTLTVAWVQAVRWATSGQVQVGGKWFTAHAAVWVGGAGPDDFKDALSHAKQLEKQGAAKAVVFVHRADEQWTLEEDRQRVLGLL